jgi:hypothetical protein
MTVNYSLSIYSLFVYNINKKTKTIKGLLWCLMPLSTIFQLYRSGQFYWWIRVITKLPNSEQSYKEKVKTHMYINRQNQSTTGKL